MSKILLVTDSTGYIERDFVEKNNIKVIPLTVEFEDETFSEGFPGEYEEYFKKLEISTSFPKTSQPPIGLFTEVFENACENGYEVIALIFSSQLSGTFNTVKLAAEMVDEEKITVIDTLTSVANLKELVVFANELILKGYSRDEIVSEIYKRIGRNSAVLVPDSLEYLRRGGRLSSIKAFIGTKLNIKPIIKLKDGKLIVVNKVRGRKKAIEAMINEIPDNVKTISVGHVQNIEAAKKLRDILKEKYPDKQIEINEVGPVIGSHLGPNAFGIAFSW